MSPPRKMRATKSCARCHELYKYRPRSLRRGEKTVGIVRGDETCTTVAEINFCNVCLDDLKEWFWGGGEELDPEIITAIETRDAAIAMGYPEYFQDMLEGKKWLYR